MTLQTEIGVTLDQHFLVNRTVRVVTGDAAFTHGVVFENKRSLLGGMALGAGIVFSFEAAGAAFDGVTFVRIMAIGAAHFAGENWVAMGEAEFAALIEMALKAGFGRLAWINDGALAAAGLHVLAAGAMAAFAAEALGVLALNDELRVGGGVEIFDGIFVALCALF